ncbi:sun domain-containing protein 1-like [Copidosoma floridanum]|uniref:sun domain-containing protein 1-like n=1 Tax=Copidosoma floridanum TaxID=29053 RepID=UPI0006C93FA3|nr:sun domain-containing protein 1-like [Copidosoma floridanum]
MDAGKKMIPHEERTCDELLKTLECPFTWNMSCIVDFWEVVHEDNCDESESHSHPLIVLMNNVLCMYVTASKNGETQRISEYFDKYLENCKVHLDKFQELNEPEISENWENEKALVLYEDVINNISDMNDSVLLKLALGFTQLGSFEKAKLCLDKVGDKWRKKSMYMHYYGNYYMKTKKFKEAKDCFEKAVEKSHNLSAERQYVQCLIKLNKKFDVTSYLSKMLHKYEHFTKHKLQPIFLDLAFCFWIKENDMNKALDYFYQTLNINPQSLCLTNYSLQSLMLGSNSIKVYEKLKNDFLPRINFRRKKFSAEEIEKIDRIAEYCNEYAADTHVRTNSRKSPGHVVEEEVRILMESKDEFKNQLTEVSLVVPKLSEAIFHLRTEISEVIETHANKLEQSAGNLKDLVRTELEAFSEDHAGKTDYALELLGGTVLTVRDTQTYDAGAPQLKIFGMAICAQQNTPRAIIQANTLPGECWAIKGDKGVAVIQLIGPVRVSGFSLEHISATIAPTGETSTAPKDFSVWGLNDIDDTNGFLFGEYRYDNSGVRVQYFQAKNEPNKSYEIVELKIHSNSGNTKYTCIYRFRVHGTLTSQQRGIS